MVKSSPRKSRGARTRGTTDRREETQRIAEMIELTAGAKEIADRLGEKFLAYLLAMAILEMSLVDSRRAVARGSDPPAAAASSSPD